MSVIEKLQSKLSRFLCDMRLRKKKHLRCKCLKSSKIPNTCVFGEAWFKKSQKAEGAKPMSHYVKTYENLVNSGCLDDRSQEKAIKVMDLTFQDLEYFSEGQEGLPKLERVTKALSLFNPQIGYAKGMIILAKVFLLHCEEHVAFWNIVTICKKLDMKNLFNSSCFGLTRHIQVFNVLLYTHMPLISSQIVRQISYSF